MQNSTPFSYFLLYHSCPVTISLSRCHQHTRTRHTRLPFSFLNKNSQIHFAHHQHFSMLSTYMVILPLRIHRQRCHPLSFSHHSATIINPMLFPFSPPYSHSSLTRTKDPPPQSRTQSLLPTSRPKTNSMSLLLAKTIAHPTIVWSF